MKICNVMRIKHTHYITNIPHIKTNIGPEVLNVSALHFLQSHTFYFLTQAVTGGGGIVKGTPTLKKDDRQKLHI